jgi:signal transduction histidine kinase
MNETAGRNWSTNDPRGRTLALLTQRHVDRSEFMRELCLLVPGSRVAVLLWLVDIDWRLLVLNRYASNVTDEVTPKELENLLLERSPDVPAGEPWVTIIEQCPEIRQWARRHGFDNGQVVLPVALDAGVSIAYAQLLSAEQLDQEQVERLRPICEGLAAFLVLSREQRELVALKDIQTLRQPELSIRQRLTHAAEVVRRNISAKACLVFRELPKGGFRADAIVPGDPDRLELKAERISVIKRVAQIGHARRVPKFYDTAMRTRAFDSDAHDVKLGQKVEDEILNEPIRSVLIAPVMIERHPIAVMVLLNKRSDSHLGAIFSETDKTVLEIVCSYLSGTLPSIVMNEAMRAIGEIVSPRALSDPVEKRRLFEIIERAIPGVRGAALVRQHRGDIEPQLDALGEPISTTDARLVFASLDEHVKIAQFPDDDRYLYTTPIKSDVLDRTCYLTVEMTRDFLLDFEKRILTFFKKELLHLLLLEQNLDSLTGNFTELRHALRTGLTGVVGYVHEAIGCYEIYKSLGYAPSALNQARFRKSLERARFAAQTTTNLLEESRILLGQINRTTLRVGSYSLVRLVRRVLDNLRPYAGERRIELVFDNSIPANNDLASIDRQLVEMAIFNVVDNAIKYSHREESVRVRLGRSRTRDWVIEVADHGTLINPEDREIIFEPFVRRSTGETGRARPGTGLGLPVAKRIVTAHGGSIDFKSIPIDGANAAVTTFVVRFPRVLPEVKE